MKKWMLEKGQKIKSSTKYPADLYGQYLPRTKSNWASDRPCEAKVSPNIFLYKNFYFLSCFMGREGVSEWMNVNGNVDKSKENNHNK